MMQYIPKSDSNWRHVLRWPAERHLLEASQGMSTKLTFSKDHFCTDIFTFIVTPNFSPLSPSPSPSVARFILCFTDVSVTTSHSNSDGIQVFFIIIIILNIHECGTLSPRHGASSGCGWRNGLLYGGQLWINWISSRGQPTRGGPPAWGLGEVLTTPLRKKHMLRITHKLRCFLWKKTIRR